MNENKPMRLSIASILKKMDKQTIRFDHPLQRHSEQWSKLMVGNLISDILQKNPIPQLVFAEQFVNGIPIVWDLDGKQRCTNVKNFVEGVKGFEKIHKKVTRYMIEYHVPVLDEDGNPSFDEDNFPICEMREFDIRGKKFTELPDELQERFMDYSFEIIKYLDCTSEDIAYHIARYNEGRPMNVSQKGITRLGVSFAGKVKNIVNSDFFKGFVGNYSDTHFKNGTIERVVVESIMATYHLDDWTKEYSDICEYLKENATKDEFENFESLADRLAENIDETAATMFTTKDSFMWFALYSEFVKFGLGDEKFNKFVIAVKDGMYDDKGKLIKDIPASGICIKEIDGTTLEDMFKSTSTKDTNLVKNRITFLLKLMCDYLNVELPTEGSDEDVEVQDTKETSEIGETTHNGSLDNFKNEFIKTEIPYNTDRTALKTLMQFTSYPTRDFTPKGIGEFMMWLNENEIDSDIYDDCLFSTLTLRDYLNDAGAADNFSENDIAMLIYMIYTIGDDLDEELFEAWLENFENTNNCDQYGDNQSLLEKETFMSSSLTAYIINVEKGE